jgi:ATP dependent DNA ligase domain
MSAPELVFPQFDPMPLASLHAPFDHPDWIFELKYDGFRALAYIEAGACRLVSRKRTQYKIFPQLSESIAAVIPGQVVLDGEIVHLASDGRPMFYELMRRPRSTTMLSICFGLMAAICGTNRSSNASGCFEGLCDLRSYMWITSRRVVWIYSRPRASATWRVSLRSWQPGGMNRPQLPG